MRTRTILITAVAAVATLAVGAAGAQAQTINAGEFAVTMPMPGETKTGGANQPTCSPAIETVAMTGGSTTCTMDETITGDTATGTVANATLAAQYGDAFNNGTMTRTCDMVQKMSMKATFAAGASTSMSAPQMSVNGEMTISCAWKMSFPDAEASSLSGAMDVSAKIDTNDLQGTAVSGGDIQMTLKVFVTEGTGVFAGYTGSGEMDAAQAFSLLGGGGGGGQVPAQQPSGGQAIPDAVCSALGLSSGCTAAQVTAACTQPANASNPICTSKPFAAVRAAVRQGGEADMLTLKLVKSAGQVRIISPLPAAGKKAAKVKATTKVKLVATKGAKCTVKASTGKVVGTTTPASSSKAVALTPKRGSLTGARWIQATCTAGGKSFSSTRVNVSL